MRCSHITTISSGGATIDSGGFDVTWTTPLTGAGNLTKIGAGSLNLNGVNTYAGSTTVSAGTRMTRAASASPAPGRALRI